MNKIACFFTDDKHISFLEWQSIYSFWLRHRNWKINLYSSRGIPETSNKTPNYFENVKAFADSTFELVFSKLQVSGVTLNNDASLEAKQNHFNKYVEQELHGYVLKGDRIYLSLLAEHEGYLIDKTLPVYRKEDIDMSTQTGQMISLFNSSFVIDMVNYYTKEGNILDIGCGDKLMSNQILNRNILMVDGFEPFKPDKVLDLNITPLPFTDNSYDTILMLDLIEHLDKDKGEALLADLKRIATKRIILLTPLWWDDNSHNVTNPTSSYYGNEYDRHRSLWILEDFKDCTRLTTLTNLQHYFFGIWEKT
jgi:hypothetical protein